MSDNLINLDNNNKLLLTPFDSRIVREFIDTLRARAEAAETRVKELEEALRFHVDDAVKAWSAHEAAETRAEAAEAYAEELEARSQGKVTGRLLHDIFVNRMAHAYVDEDPTELKGVRMDGYFNLIQIAEDIKSALREEKPNACKMSSTP